MKELTRFGLIARRERVRSDAVRGGFAVAKTKF
jgi:hypothetical protein